MTVSVHGGVALVWFVGADAALRFKIKSWNGVAMWSWDICTDTCAICRNKLTEPSIEYQVRRFSRSSHNHTHIVFMTTLGRH